MGAFSTKPTISDLGTSTISDLETLLGAINIILSTEMDSEAKIEALAGAINLLVSTEMDSEAEIEALASIAMIVESEIDSEAEVEAIMGAVNLIVATEISNESQLEALIGGLNLILDSEMDTEAKLEGLVGVAMATEAEATAAAGAAVTTHEGAYTHGDISTNTAARHTRLHAITDASDHSVGTVAANEVLVNLAGALVSSGAVYTKFGSISLDAMRMALNRSDLATGLGATFNVSVGGIDAELVLLNTGRADGAGNIACALVWDRAQAAGTEMTGKQLAVGFTDDANAFQEKFHVLGNGDVGLNKRVNGQKAEILSLTEETTIAAAAFTDTAIQVPQNALAIAASVRVTTVIPGPATTFTVGVAGDVTLFTGVGRTVAVALGSNDPGTAGGMNFFNAASSVRITPNNVPGAATGKVRVTIHYILVTPPTS